jgi:hypothetical protein
MARPTKLTPATEKVILDALRDGATRTAAFEAAGLHRSQIPRLMRRFASFRAAVIGAEASAEIQATATVRAAIAAGGWRAAAWWLERRRHQDWGRRDRVEIVDAVRQMARAAGADEDAAVAEAERYLREIRHGARD